MSEPKKKKPASSIFFHLSEEERIDKACELLATGILRLAAKEGLLGAKQKEVIPNCEDEQNQDLHQKQNLKPDGLEMEAML